MDVILNTVSDGITLIDKDGSVWGLNEFMEFSVQSFILGQSNLDCLLRYTQQIAQQKEFDDDFTILEIAFE